MRGEKGDKGEAGERVSAFHTQIWLRLLLLFFSSFLLMNCSSIHQSVFPSFRYSVCQSRGRSVGQSVGRLVGLLIGQSVGQTVSQSVGWSVGRSANR